MLLSFLSLFFWLLAPQAQPAMPVESFEKADKVRLEFYIVFGKYRPEIDDCTGFGICDFRLVVEGGISATNQSGMATGETTENGKLKLTFARRTGLSEPAFRKYFASGGFLVEADYPVSDDICRKLGLRRGYLIKAGKYPVQREGNLLSLIL